MDIMELEQAFRELSKKLDRVIDEQIETKTELAKLKSILTGNGIEKGAIKRLHERIDKVEENSNKRIKTLESKLWGVIVGFLMLLAGIVLKFHMVKF